MNFKLTIIALMFCLVLQAQEKTQIDTTKIEISSKTKTIYVLGGIASVISKEDIAFAKKYNIQYHDFGCLAPINFNEYEAKNALVFEYLNKTFGIQWQQEIKPNVLGFEKWKVKKL